MRRIAPVAVLVLLALVLVGVVLPGCSSSGEAAPDQTQDASDEIYPDTLLTGEETDYPTSEDVFLSAVLDEEGKPVAGARVFSPDTPVIYLRFELAEDLCCQTVIVQWWYKGEVIDAWSVDDYHAIVFMVALQQPDGGFGVGDYSARVYVQIKEVIRLDFSIR